MKQSRILTVLAVLLAAALLVLPAAAIDITGEGVNVTVAETQLVGGDKDEHGCIGSAGYTWCEAKEKCLREWEEPCEVTTTLSNELMPGGDKDEHGCIGSAGYTWCEAKQKCLREWEEPCAAAATSEVPAEATAVPTTKSPLPVAVVIGAIGAAFVLAAVRKD